MTAGELWLKSLDLATIATWIMIIGFALLLYISRPNKKSQSSRK